MKTKNTKANGDKMVVILDFEGRDADRFKKYMERENIKAKATAAKKAILDHLDSLDAAAA